jgi:hypothetical protein
MGLNCSTYAKIKGIITSNGGEIFQHFQQCTVMSDDSQRIFMAVDLSELIETFLSVIGVSGSAAIQWLWNAIEWLDGTANLVSCKGAETTPQ